MRRSRRIDGGTLYALLLGAVVLAGLVALAITIPGAALAIGGVGIVIAAAILIQRKIDRSERSARIPGHQAPPAVAAPVLIGATPWGVVVLADSPQAAHVVAVALPIADARFYDAMPAFPPGLVTMVVAFNGGSGGVLAASRVARRAGLATVYACDPSRPIDRGIADLDAPVSVSPLPRRGHSQSGTAARFELHPAGLVAFLPSGCRVLLGYDLDLRALLELGVHHGVGTISARMGTSPYTPLAPDFAFPASFVILAAAGGIDADAQAAVLRSVGVAPTIIDAPATDIGASSEAPLRPLDRIRGLLIAGDFGAADRAIAAALGETLGDADRRDILYQQGIGWLMRRDEGAAITAFEAAAELGSGEACSSLANMVARQDGVRAGLYASRAMELLPGDAIAIRTAVQVHLVAGDQAGAERCLAAHAEALSRDDRLTLEALVQSGGTGLTFEHTFPQHAQLMADAAQPHLDAGRYAEAEAMVRRAVELDPGNPARVGDLGWVLGRLGRDAEAIALYDRTIARGGTTALLCFNRGVCHLRRATGADSAEAVAAVADFRACLALRDAWDEARINLVSALCLSGDLPGARAELRTLEQRGVAADVLAALGAQLERRA